MSSLICLYCKYITMKAKITVRDAKRLHAYKIWYCDAQCILRFEDPIFYTSNQYGRRADFYKIEHPDTWDIVRVSTWYWPIGDKYINYERLKIYEEKAQALDRIMLSGDYYYRDRRKAHRRLFFEMLEDHFETTEELINFAPLSDYVIKNETD